MLDIAMQYLQGQRFSLGLRSADITDLVVTDRYLSSGNGKTHLYLRQTHNGLAVVNGTATLTLDSNGDVVGMGDRLRRNLATRAPAAVASISAAEAVLAAAEQLGVSVAGLPDAVSIDQGVARTTIFPGGRLSRQPVPVHLAYFETASGELRLVWDLQIHTLDGRHYWHAWVDASSGRLLGSADWVSYDDYQVFEFPSEHPNEDGDPYDDDRTTVVDPPDLIASPYGWHDVDGIAGAEFTDTRGNNVFAQEDRDSDDSGGLRPDGGMALHFQPPLDLTRDPQDYQDASVTNLFYWNNLLHDILYQYGFDEASGNFQQNNYARGGLGGDPVQADAQDGSGVNNANFTTPPDGNPAVRMQMFEWLHPTPNELQVHSPAAIADTYTASSALFGPAVPLSGLSGTLVLVDDGSSASSEGCFPLRNGTAIAGNIALVDRGSCTFVSKVRNAQDAGASSVVVVNNVSGAVITLGGEDTGIQIPSGMISLEDGNRIKAALGATVSVTFQGSAGRRNRDSALDNGVIAHEYCHGLSIRLTGGPSNSSCLTGDQQAGEGWSDFCALFFTAKPGEQDVKARAIGTYLRFQPADGTGIRIYPYSTDLTVNPLRYSDINSGISVPHGVGTVWATALWDMYWNLVSQYGFDSDLYQGAGGNNLAMQLVVDGLKAQPCNPSFLDARDAIIASAAAYGVDECLLWQAFAKRGMGTTAFDGGSSDSLNVTDSFTEPAACENLCLNERRVSHRLISGSETHRGAVSLILGPHLTHAATAQVTALAGASVAFQGPLSIDGVLAVNISDTVCNP